MNTNTRGVVAFLVLVFGIAWSVWEIPLRLGVPLNSTLFQVLVVPGAFAPAIAAILVRKWITREGFADSGLQPNFRKPQYYLFAWLLPLAVVVFTAVVAPLFGFGQSADVLQHRVATPGTDLSHRLLSLPVLRLTIAALIATPILWGEEFGWRSYLQLRLFGSRPLFAAIATGLVWGVWHFPLLARGSEFPLHPYWGLAIFPLGTVLYSIVLGWLRLRSRTVWTSSFAHSAINNLGSPLLPLLFPTQPDMFFISLFGLFPLALIAALIVLSGGLKPVRLSEEVR